MFKSRKPRSELNQEKQKKQIHAKERCHCFLFDIGVWQARWDPPFFCYFPKQKLNIYRIFYGGCLNRDIYCFLGIFMISRALDFLCSALSKIIFMMKKKKQEQKMLHLFVKINFSYFMSFVRLSYDKWQSNSILCVFSLCRVDFFVLSSIKQTLERHVIQAASDNQEDQRRITRTRTTERYFYMCSHPLFDCILVSLTPTSKREILMCTHSHKCCGRNVDDACFGWRHATHLFSLSYQRLSRNKN